MPQGRSRAQHFVPRFHLRAFSCDPFERRYVWAYDKLSKHTKRVPVGKTALSNDYNTYRTASGPRDDVDRALTEIERRAARAIGELLRLSPGRLLIPKDVRAAIAAYVATLWMRVPASRKRTEHLTEEVSDFMTRLRLEHPEGFADDLRKTGWRGTDEEGERFRLDWLNDVESGRGRFVATHEASLQDVAVGLSMAPYIEAMGWRLVTVMRWPFFVLGDAPVTLWAGRDSPEGPIGLLTPGAELAVPLRPETVLVTSFGPRPDWHLLLDDVPGFPGPTALALPYSYRSLATADRLVYTRSSVNLDAALAYAPDLA
jgi:hypothetical protein